MTEPLTSVTNTVDSMQSWSVTRLYKALIQQHFSMKLYLTFIDSSFISIQYSVSMIRDQHQYNVFVIYQSIITTLSFHSTINE